MGVPANPTGAERLRWRHAPLVFKAFLLFLFFFPLRFFEIPGKVIGFSVNPARTLIVLTIFLACMAIAMHPGRRWFRGRENRYVYWIASYFALSIAYYYALVWLGETVRFAEGTETSFFRNWRGRAIAQYLVFCTYGVAVYVVTRAYAQRAAARKLMERFFIGSTLLIIAYGYVQQLAYQVARTPLTYRTLGDDTLTTAGPNDLFLRFYSLAGEPRDLGTFMVGAVCFYVAARVGDFRVRTVAAIMLMVLAFLLSISTSAFAAALLALVLIACDAVWRVRATIVIRFRAPKRIVGTGIALLLIVVTGIAVGAASVIIERPIQYWHDVTTDIREQQQNPSVLSQAQAPDIMLIPYVIEALRTQPSVLVLGYGYSHFLNPLSVTVLREYFAFDALTYPGFYDARSYLNKVVVETGFVGALFFLLLFVRTLHLNSMLRAHLRATGDTVGMRKALWMRVTYIAFFSSAMVHISFYHFFILGLMVGWLREQEAAAALRGAAEVPACAVSAAPSGAAHVRAT